MRFATWNIGSLYSDFDTFYPFVRDSIVSTDVDIICLQEYPTTPELSDLFKRIGKYDSGMYVKCSLSHICVGVEMGVQIYSRTPLKYLDKVYLPMPDRAFVYNGKTETLHPKAFVAMETVIQNKRVLVFTGHGFSFNRYGLDDDDLFEFTLSGLNQFFSEVVSNNEHDYIIIGGDFNCHDASKFIPFLRENFYDVFKDRATRPSGRKTDAIYLPIGTTVSNEQMIKSDMDHYLLSIEL